MEKEVITGIFWFVGGVNTLIVFLAFINKPVRVWMFKKFRQPEELQNARIIKIEENQVHSTLAIRALLSDRLHQSCLYYLKCECISVGDMANIDTMYKEYKELGGNGLIENMVFRVRDRKSTRLNSSH